MPETSSPPGHTMRSPTPTDFFITGGTVPRDALCYVTRAADEELFQSLRRGEFSYVLTSRQMGKSSLMVRTAARLREAGDVVVVLDLTSLGQNLSAEQWYDGLLVRVGDQLGFEDELDGFWADHRRLGPLQRFMAAFKRVILPQLAARGATARLVVFIDEIDTVRSLPFSTDEFFAAIRECYNRRTEDRDYERLTFCLLGVATPSDLIRDTRLTPFNIGRRIELQDFAQNEIGPLAAGLALGGPDTRVRSRKEAAQLLRRVLFWTGGHPYLTQRACEALASESATRGAAGVDRLCAELFLSPRAREADDNLLFVRERLLKGEAELAALLELYGRILVGRRVAPDETNPLLDLLRLSGIVRIEQNRSRFRNRTYRGRLVVRNRIYARVFDRAWVQRNMPHAELRRQRVAYRRGVLRTAGVSAVLLLVMGGLTTWAVRSSRDSQRLFYFANMNLIQAHFDADPLHLDRVHALLQETRHNENRGFEWGYWWRRCHPEYAMVPGATEIAPNGRLVLGLSPDGQVQLSSAETGNLIRVLDGGTGGKATEPRFTADGNRVIAEVSNGSSRVLTVWDTASGGVMGRRPIPGSAKVHPSPDGRLTAVVTTGLILDLVQTRGSKRQRLAQYEDGSMSQPVYSLDGNRLVTFCIQNGRPVAALWDPRSGELIRRLPEGVQSAEFSENGTRLLTAGSEPPFRFQVWDALTGRPLTEIAELPIGSVAALSPDGSRAILPTTPVQVCDTATGRMISTFQGLASPAYPKFSPDGRWVTFRQSEPASVWVTETGARLVDLPELDGSSAIAYSRDGGRVAALCSRDGAFRIEVYDLTAGKRLQVLTGIGEATHSLAFSPDGCRLMSCGRTLDSGSQASLWEWRQGRRSFSITAPGPSLSFAKFSRDGRRIVAREPGSSPLGLWEWDAGTGRKLREASAPPPTLIPGGTTSPDGEWTLVSRATKRLELFKVMGGGRGRVLACPSANLTEIRFSTDGTRLAAIGPDGTYVWETTSGRELCRLGEGLASPGVALSPDLGRALFTWNAGGQAKALLSDATSGRTVRAIAGPESSYSGSSQFSASGERVVAMGRVLDARTGRVISTLGAATQSYGRTLVLSPDGSRVASYLGGQPGTLYDADTGREIRTLSENNPGIVPKFTPDSRSVVCSGNGSVLRVFDAISGRETRSFDFHPALVSFSREGRRILADGRLLRLEGHAGGSGELTPDWMLDEHVDPKQVEVTPDGRHLLAGYTVWNISPAGLSPQVTLDPPDGESATLAPDGRRMLVGEEYPVVWDLQGRIVLRLPHGESAVRRFSPDGRWIVLATAGGVSIRSAATGGEVRRIPTAAALTHLAFSRDGSRLVAAHGAAATIWDFANGRKLRTLTAGADVSEVRLSADGRNVAAGLTDGSAWVWRLSRARPVLVLRGHTGAVRGLAWTGDGRRIITGSDDGLIKFWDSQGGREALTLRSKQPVRSVDLTPDDLRLFTASPEVPARIWEAAPAKTADARDAAAARQRKVSELDVE